MYTDSSLLDDIIIKILSQRFTLGRRRWAAGGNNKFYDQQQAVLNVFHTFCSDTPPTVKPVAATPSHICLSPVSHLRRA